ncbi:MAG TPA: polysaccharide biosynthesis tyrosine autokinase, partial [Opitutaceae bacterium]|nr:polysaccharide biosynthesis tyrosine autokinase [Opitutaceae bacterium]
STRELLLAEVKRDSATLQTSEEKLEAYRKKYNAVSLEDQQNIVVDRLRELNRQAVEAQNTRLAIEPEAEQVRSLSAAGPDQLLGVHQVADNQEIVDLRQQIALQKAQVATLAKRYGPLHPTMIQAQSHLQALQSSLDAALRRAADRIIQSYEAAKATENALKAALAEQEKVSMQLDQIAIPYHALEREVQANSTVFQKMLATLKQVDAQHSLMTLTDADGFDIRTIEQPMVPARPVRPRSKLILALSVVAGLFLGCGSALITRALDNTVSSVDAAESFLGLPVLTTVPRSRHQRLTAQPVLIKYPASAEAEAFRSLRTSLSLLPGQEEQRCILFTSAVPGEGKSFCSLNTAAALAQQGFQTLLIDGDLRRPSLQRLLVAWNENPGLTDCLQRPDLFPSAVQPTSMENLFCLGDRKYRPGGAELLGRDGLRAILQRAQTIFDRIVIDTAPLMAVSDTLYIAKNVSTLCLVVHAGRTPRRLVRRAIKHLDEIAKCTATGVILNKADRRTAAGSYYYYSAAARA